MTNETSFSHADSQGVQSLWRHVRFEDDCPTLSRFAGELVRPVVGRSIMIAQVHMDPFCIEESAVTRAETIIVGCDGTMQALVEDDTVTLAPGEVLILPAGTRYSFRSGAAPCTRLDVLSPPDVEIIEEGLHQEHAQHGFE